MTLLQCVLASVRAASPGALEDCFSLLPRAEAAARVRRIGGGGKAVGTWHQAPAIDLPPALHAQAQVDAIRKLLGWAWMHGCFYEELHPSSAIRGAARGAWRFRLWVFTMAFLERHRVLTMELEVFVSAWAAVLGRCHSTCYMQTPEP